MIMTSYDEIDFVIVKQFFELSSISPFLHLNRLIIFVDGRDRNCHPPHPHPHLYLHRHHQHHNRHHHIYHDYEKQTWLHRRIEIDRGMYNIAVDAHNTQSTAADLDFDSLDVNRF